MVRSATLLLLAGSFVGIANAQDSSPQGSILDGQPANCNAWHTIVDGDDCDNVPKKFGITRAQFLEWNPAVSSDCLQGFWLKYAYCVGVGDKKTSTSGATSTSISSTVISSSSTSVVSTSQAASATTPYSIREPVTSQNISTPSTDSLWPPKATQSGQPESCNEWHLVTSGDTCQTVMNRYGALMTLDQL